MKTVSQTEFAKLRGVARKTVIEWLRKGVLVLNGDGKICLDASNAVLDARPATYRGGTIKHAPGTPPPFETLVTEATGWTTAEAVRRKEIALALTRQLEYDVASGKLINAADVESIMRGDYASTATRILGLPSKLAPRVITMKTPEEAESLMHSEFVKALDSLSKGASAELRTIDGPVS